MSVVHKPMHARLGPSSLTSMTEVELQVRVEAGWTASCVDCGMMVCRCLSGHERLRMVTNQRPPVLYLHSHDKTSCTSATSPHSPVKQPCRMSTPSRTLPPPLRRPLQHPPSHHSRLAASPSTMPTPSAIVRPHRGRHLCPHCRLPRQSTAACTAPPATTPPSTTSSVADPA